MSVMSPDWTGDADAPVDRNGLEILDRAECLRLLAGATLGRIGINSGALPVILPVNYVLDGERVLIRTSPGSKLDAAAKDAVVAFEADEIGELTKTGWSVSVTGVARVVSDPDELEQVQDLPLVRWAPSPAAHVIAISTDLMSGRRIL